MSRDDEQLDVTGLTFDLLQAIIESAPNVVSHDELVGLAQLRTSSSQLAKQAKSSVYKLTVEGSIGTPYSRPVS